MTSVDGLNLTQELVSMVHGDVDDETLLDCAADWAAIARAYADGAYSAEQEVRRRMAERNVSELLAGGVLATLNPAGNQYTWDNTQLKERIAGKVTPSELAQIIETEEIPAQTITKVNTVRLLAIAKRRGIDLDGAYSVAPKAPPKLSVRPATKVGK